MTEPVINPRWQIRSQRSLEKFGNACAEAMGLRGIDWNYYSIPEGRLDGVVYYAFRRITLTIPKKGPTLSSLEDLHDLIVTQRCRAALYEGGYTEWNEATLLKVKTPTSRNKKRVVVHELCHLLLYKQGIFFPHAYGDSFDEWERQHQWPFAKHVCDWCEKLFGWRHP